MEKNEPDEVPAYVSAGSLESKQLYAGWLNVIVIALILVALFLLAWNYKVAWEYVGYLYNNRGDNFELFVLAGFIAQMIDGALGMAYGVSASTVLLSLGVPPAAASASIHTSEIFTSGVSGLMHLKFQNVNKKLFK